MSKTIVQAGTLALFFTLGTVGCATTSTTATTWSAPPEAQPEWARPGRVEWIREVVHREEGDPIGGAVVGGLVGALIGGHGSAAVAGAIGGAAVGAAVSQGSAESRTYEVMVMFQDGGYQVFVYNGYTPFRPGEPVVLTPRGLDRNHY